MMLKTIKTPNPLATPQPNRACCLPMVLSMVLLTLATGCNATYSPRHHYDPQPAELVWNDMGANNGEVRGLVSIIGLRYADASPADVPTFEVRLRLTNQTDQPVSLAPGDVELTNAALESFGQAWFEPQGPVIVQPDAQEIVNIFLPATEQQAKSKMDLEGLHLSVRLHRGPDAAQGEGVRRGVSFSRRRDAEREPGMMIHVGGGFGYLAPRHRWRYY